MALCTQITIEKRKQYLTEVRAIVERQSNERSDLSVEDSEILSDTKDASVPGRPSITEKERRPSSSFEREPPSEKFKSWSKVVPEIRLDGVGHNPKRKKEN